ncbi:trypsin-1-like [Bacillus rossius redtenbacheri]|uniref:trypsin-1-like n=1 Tax=Bacillus rossius redtenbacheri TaxID=93214 RepID=UPI002FDDAB14
MSPIAVFASLLAVGLALPQQNARLNERKFQLDGKIVGGTSATIQQYPWMVSLRETSDSIFGSEESHICGGSIVSNNYVLTAGHCCENEDASSLVVRVGNTDGDNGERHEISQIILHPQFVTKYNVPYNDVCLLKVSKPFTFSSSVKAVTLPAANSQTSVGTMATTTGWGSTYYGGDVTRSLMQVSLPVVSLSECISDYGKNKGGSDYVDDSMICAGYTQGGKDACQGDSGGPMTVSGTQVGVVSWGAGCAEANYPGVYADVSHFVSWIKSTAGI